MQLKLKEYKFNVGDFVFCKWGKSPPWPARIKLIKEVKGKRQYKVIFYGTFDFAFCYGHKLYPYSVETKARLLKRKALPEKLKTGIMQMEEDIVRETEEVQLI